MRRAVAALAVVVWVLCSWDSSARSQPARRRGLLPQDYYREVTVGDVAVSPNGTTVAFTVTTVLEQQNRRHREVWIERLRAASPDGPPVRVSNPAAESSAPQWSPDGSTLSFTSERNRDTLDVWFVTVGSTIGEAHNLPGVDAPPVWSPDGRWIAFGKEDGEVTAAAVHAGSVTDAPSAHSLSNTLDAKRFDGRIVNRTRYKRDGTLDLLPDPALRRKRQVYLVPAAGGQARQLTEVPFDVGSLQWSSDSRLILFTGDEREDDDYGAQPSEQIYAISRSGGRPRAFTTDLGSHRSPAWSPSGNRVAFISAQSPAAKPNVMVADVARDGHVIGVPRNLTTSWDLTPGAPFWTGDGNVRFLAESRGDVHLFEVSAAGGAVRQVTTGARTLSSVSSSRDGSVLAFAADHPLAPAELFVCRGDGSGERKATSFNDTWLRDTILAPPERLAWRVADGTEIEGWLVRPVPFVRGRKYPLVLKIHGGPHAQYGNTWFATSHILSNAGMFVLYANPRGSTGYGHRFMYATRGRWGEMDSEDLLKGVDAALARYHEIDPGRLGVSGGSYGGYMSNWLTATTTRFAAAVTSRSIVNWESWYGASDSQGLTEYEFFGPPWEQRDLYRRLSPISYVERVTAPTLIIEGENDYRTPIVEGEQWFMALKKRHVPVEMIRYPRSSHGLSRSGEPWLLVDRLERIRSWFVEWLVERAVSQGMRGSPS